MKFLTVLCLILGVVSAVFAAPEDGGNELVVQPPQSVHEGLLVDSRKLIEQLVGNLRKSAQEAITAVANFTVGLKEEARHMREQIANDIEKLRIRIKEAIDNVLERISNTTAGVRECVNSRREEASNMFSETANNTLSCVDERIEDVAQQVQGLAQFATNALEYANEAIGDMQKCTEENHNMFTAGVCLSRVVIRVKAKSIFFQAQSVLTIGGINLSIATLPAAMEVCAGTKLVQAGLAAGRIIVQIGGCSASTIFSGIIGSTSQNQNTLN